MSCSAGGDGGERVPPGPEVSHESRAAAFADFGRVRFAEPRGRARVGRRLWFNAVYFLVLGVWAVAGSWDRHRALGIAAAFVYLELTLATFRVATLAGAVVREPRMVERIARPLVELCRAAHCPVPTVVVRDDAVRAASVRRFRGRVSLVVSRPFVDRIDDRQLRALFAHELVHVVRNDFAAIRARAWASTAIMLTVCIVVGVAEHDTLNYAVLLAIALAAGIVANAVLSTANRRLEWRADLEGARLCGDPAGLASALSVAHTFSTEARRRVYGRLPWRVLLSPVSWRLPTHPPMAQRIARLERLAASG